MPAQVNVCREREPWGPSSVWFAEIIAGGVVACTTDFAPSRSAALRAAQVLAAARGYEVTL